MDHARYATRVVGARGAMLLTLAGLWFWLFTLPLILVGEVGSRAPDVFYYDWPAWARAAAWGATSALAVLAAFVPPRKDWFGWVALAVMPAERFFAWAWSGVTFLASDGAAGEAYAWHQTPLYGFLVAAVLIASAMRPPVLDDHLRRSALGGGEAPRGGT